MCRASFLALLIPATCFAGPPTQSEVDLAWSRKPELSKPVTLADVQWAWAKLKKDPCDCEQGCPCCQTGKCSCKDRNECAKRPQSDVYNELRDRAIREGRALVVGVGCEPPRGDFLSCRWDNFPGVKSGMVVGVPEGRELIQRGTLPANAPASQVGSFAHLKKIVVPPPI